MGHNLFRDRSHALTRQDARHAGGMRGSGDGSASSDQLWPVDIEVASTRNHDHVEVLEVRPRVGAEIEPTRQLVQERLIVSTAATNVREVEAGHQLLTGTLPRAQPAQRRTVRPVGDDRGQAVRPDAPQTL